MNKILRSGWQSRHLLRPHQTVVDVNRSGGIWSVASGFFGLNKGSTSQYKLNSASLKIYEHIADRTDYATFFLTYNMPNTFNSWFLTTELHVWMILTRVMAQEQEPENGRVLRNMIVEALWNDANTRARQLAADNPSMCRKQLQELSQQFQSALITYDEGLAGDDKVLASALWERFFEKNCQDYSHLAKLVAYVRREVAFYDGVPYQEIIESPVKLFQRPASAK